MATQIFLMFIPIWGNDPNLTCAYVSNGLVKNHQLVMIWLSLHEISIKIKHDNVVEYTVVRWILWVWEWSYKTITLPETNVAPWKMVISNRNLLFQRSIFTCELLVLGRVNDVFHHKTLQISWDPPLRVPSFQWKVMPPPAPAQAAGPGPGPSMSRRDFFLKKTPRFCWVSPWNPTWLAGKSLFFVDRRCILF